MTAAVLDRLLGILIAVVAATGLLTLRAGDPGLAAVYTAHGIAACVLAAAIVVKLARSVPRAVAARRWAPLTLAGAVAAASILSLAGGIVWATGGGIVTLSGWTLLTLHAWAGLVLAPLLAAHLLPRRWRLLWPGRWLGGLVTRATGAGRAQAVPPRGPSRRPWSRRSVLAAGALAFVGVAGWSAGNLIDALRGGERRFTGSRWLSPGGIPPTTTFFGEGAPAIAEGAWRLTVHGRVARPTTYTLEGLQGLAASQLVGTLDCTSGWAIETTWSGVPTAAVLAAAGVDPGATRVDVRSVTGWGAGLSIDEANGTLLATHLAGERLPAGNGAPCRLVVPGRRGLDWVKWVTEIEVT